MSNVRNTAVALLLPCCCVADCLIRSCVSSDVAYSACHGSQAVFSFIRFADDDASLPFRRRHCCLPFPPPELFVFLALLLGVCRAASFFFLLTTALVVVAFVEVRMVVFCCCCWPFVRILPLLVVAGGVNASTITIAVANNSPPPS